MNAYKLRSAEYKLILRRIASMRLVNSGCEEVGTSDINHELHAMFNEYEGDFDVALLDSLSEYAA